MSDHYHGSNTNAFLLGLIVGGVLGILFAPDKGEETRKKVRKNYKEWSKQALEMAEELGEEVKPRVEEAVETISRSGIAEDVEQTRTIQPIVQEAGEIIEPRLEEAQETVKEGFDEVVQRARAELKRRIQRPRPQQFKGV